MQYVLHYVLLKSKHLSKKYVAISFIDILSDNFPLPRMIYLAYITPLLLVNQLIILLVTVLNGAWWDHHKHKGSTGVELFSHIDVRLKYSTMHN